MTYIEVYSPDHTLIPISSHCHIDLTASACLEADSCSSEGKRAKRDSYNKYV